MSKTLQKIFNKKDIEKIGGWFYGKDIPYKGKLNFKGREYTLIWIGRLPTDFKVENPEITKTKELGIGMLLVKRKMFGDDWAGLYSAL